MKDSILSLSLSLSSPSLTLLLSLSSISLLYIPSQSCLLRPAHILQPLRCGDKILSASPSIGKHKAKIVMRLCFPFGCCLPIEFCRLCPALGSSSPVLVH